MTATTSGLIRDKASVPAQFDQIASGYDLATGLSQGYTSDLHRSVQLLELKGHENVADLCCGTGKSTLPCLRALPHGKVIAIDNSAEMLNQAGANLSKEYPESKLQLMQKDVMDLDFEANTFDAIFMAYGIRNMPDYRKCLKNLLHILKPGGRICFHEYSLADNFLVKIYWRILGYTIIIPVSAFLTRSTTIFKYLIRSVLEFPSPAVFLQLLQESGYENIRRVAMPSWRRPILHSFIAYKPE